MNVFITQLCVALCDHMDCSLPGSSVHWILQARILEWVAILFSRGSSQPRDQTHVSSIAADSLLYEIYIYIYIHFPILAAVIQFQASLSIWHLDSYHWVFFHWSCTNSASQLALMVKDSPANAGDIKRHGPWIRKIPWRRAWQPTPILLPGEPHGQRSLAAYCPWGKKELDVPEDT